LGPILNKNVPIAKKILITTDSQEVVVIRKGTESPPTGFCTICPDEVPLLTLDDAVSVARVSTIVLVHHLEAGLIHGSESTDGRLFICPESLKIFDKEEYEHETNPAV
jgi:hypothetical protein